MLISQFTPKNYEWVCMKFSGKVAYGALSKITSFLIAFVLSWSLDHKQLQNKHAVCTVLCTFANIWQIIGCYDCIHTELTVSRVILNCSLSLSIIRGMVSSFALLHHCCFKQTNWGCILWYCSFCSLCSQLTVVCASVVRFVYRSIFSVCSSCSVYFFVCCFDCFLLFCIVIELFHWLPIWHASWNSLLKAMSMWIKT